MNVFAIGDLHLSGSVNKPMDIFGSGWENHAERISRSWKESVCDSDLVLLPGDFSWAMTIKDVLADLSYLNDLPGKKVLIRGNHDYWWNSLTKVRSALPPSVFAVQNDCFSYNGVHVAGTRGWACPNTPGFTAHDEKIYQRELTRLRLSMSHLPPDGYRIVMLHFPPLCERNMTSGFSEIISSARVDMVVYGHLHAKSCHGAFNGIFGGVEYRLVSADYVKFAPSLIATVSG